MHGPILLNQLNLKNKNIQGTAKIFINDYLSPANKQILYEAQQMKKKHNIQFVWAKQGAVFMRYDENSRMYRIKNNALSFGN